MNEPAESSVKMRNVAERYCLIKPGLYVLMVMALATVCCCQPVSAVAEKVEAQNIRERLERTVEYLRAIANVELKTTNRFYVAGDNAANDGFSWTSEVLFIASGLKYRTECHNASTNTNMTKTFITVYDGDTFTSYLPESRYSVRHAHDQPGDQSTMPLNPLIANLMFLTKESDMCKGCGIMFNNIYSDDLLEGSKFVNVERTNDLLRFEIPGLPMDGHSTTWRITMGATGSEFTPKTITRIVEGEGMVIHEFLAYTNLTIQQINGSPRTIEVPSLISYTAGPYSEGILSKVALTGLTCVVSIDTPEKIPDSTFIIDTKDARVIWNSDTKMVTKGAALLEAIRVRQRRIKYIALSILSVSTIIFLSLRFYRKPSLSKA